MAKPAARIGFVQLVMALGTLAVVGRSAQVQIVQGARWAAEARKERTRHVALLAVRGIIADRTGAPLADTRESYRVGIAPDQVDDPRALAGAIVRSLDRLTRSQAAIERQLRSGDRWVSFYGPYSATQIEALRPMKGVYLEALHERVYPSADLARGVIGTLASDTGVSGLEKSLDSLLRGIPGEAVNLRAPQGRQIESPKRKIREPVRGNDVFLTIDGGLQEIVERALDRAIVQLHARGADAVFLDPRNGEVLALASRQADGSISATALVSPFEPGSTAKLFTAAALLSLGRVDSTEVVNPEGGLWTMTLPGKRPVTRQIRDAHVGHEMLTLARTIGVSSNVGISKFALRLSLGEQYDMLRDFGFGSPTGVEVSSESRGQLVRPGGPENPLYPLVSRAMGYNFSVTALQLASAYGVIANDGLLVAPALVREIRSPEGAVLYRHQREPVRQVVPAAVAARLRRYLLGAVSDSGTGEEAQLQSYKLIGKTGTAHQLENGRYTERYTASFAAIFPAEHPQLVAIVKVDAPTGASYYGGHTAAPLVKEMLLEALASRTGIINRNLLAVDGDSGDRPPRLAKRAPERHEAPPPVVSIGWPPRAERSRPAPGPVPDLTGSSVRAAVTALHRRGFRVSLHGFGLVTRTDPAAGAAAESGALVSVWADR